MRCCPEGSARAPGHGLAPVTEAMYLLSDLPKAQETVWEMLARGVLQLLPLDLADVPRIRELTGKYAARG